MRLLFFSAARIRKKLVRGCNGLDFDDALVRYAKGASPGR